MIKHALTVGLTLGLVFGPWSLALAKDYNTRPFLPSRGQVKINNARAQLYVFRHQAETGGGTAEEAGKGAESGPAAKAGKGGCPDGVFVDRSNPRREVIIATKDIVNLGGQLDLRAACQ
jgi:hypothetical protein